MNSPQAFNKLFLAIVCPMANEIHSAEKFIQEALQAVQVYPWGRLVFIAVVDQASTDGTIALLREMALRIPQLQVIYAPENKHVVDAYLRGYHEALELQADWILEMDAGFSHQPHEISLFLDKIPQGYDCVFGSRFCPGGAYTKHPLKRWLVSYGGTLTANLLLGTTLSDMTSGFELFSRRALQTILAQGIESQGPFFQTEIRAFAHRFKICEVPIHYSSESSLRQGSLSDAACHLGRLLKLRLNKQLY